MAQRRLERVDQLKDLAVAIFRRIMWMPQEW
jgi:hypothetical protein